MRAKRWRRTVVGLAVALTMPQVLGLGDQVGRLGWPLVSVAAGWPRVAADGLAATASAIREQAPATWDRARRAYGGVLWWLRRPRPEQVMAQALLESVYKGRLTRNRSRVAPQSPRFVDPAIFSLYANDSFLLSRLAALDRTASARVRSALARGARQWAEGGQVGAEESERWLVDPAEKALDRASRPQPRRPIARTAGARFSGLEGLPLALALYTAQRLRPTAASPARVRKSGERRGSSATRPQ